MENRLKKNGWPFFVECIIIGIMLAQIVVGFLIVVNFKDRVFQYKDYSDIYQNNAYPASYLRNSMG